VRARLGTGLPDRGPEAPPGPVGPAAGPLRPLFLTVRLPSAAARRRRTAWRDVEIEYPLDCYKITLYGGRRWRRPILSNLSCCHFWPAALSRPSCTPSCRHIGCLSFWSAGRRVGA